MGTRQQSPRIPFEVSHLQPPQSPRHAHAHAHAIVSRGKNRFHTGMLRRCGCPESPGMGSVEKIQAVQLHRAADTDPALSLTGQWLHRSLSTLTWSPAPQVCCEKQMCSNTCSMRRTMPGIGWAPDGLSCCSLFSSPLSPCLLLQGVE